jgi:hypothetical protein
VQLNGDCRAGGVDRNRLKEALLAQGKDIYDFVAANCPYLFAGATYFITPAQLAQMREVIVAVEQTVNSPSWEELAVPESLRQAVARGAFMGYDFHLDAEGVHLIEINTNAGGAFLNDLLLRSQHGAALLGEAVSDDFEQVFLDMFRNEWKLERGDTPLGTVAIVDEQPQQQYLYCEFLFAQRMFRQAGITALIADPDDLEFRNDGVYCDGNRVDMIYNRLTDFLLDQHLKLRDAWLKQQVVLTPNPQVYARYADKRNLALLTDADALRTMGIAEDVIAVLQSGIPQVRLVDAAEREQWWTERKQWFFKPATGYGARGSYRGANITRRVFEEIMQGGYVAQQLAMPGERMVCVDENEPAAFKVDVRCYVYSGEVQLVVARLYQGQTTNFRTSGGGFAPVRIV